MRRLKNGSFTVEILNSNAYSNDGAIPSRKTTKGYGLLTSHWKALTLRSKKALIAQPTKEHRLKGSLLAKRPVADATLSTSDQTNGNFPVQPIEDENSPKDGGISC